MNTDVAFQFAVQRQKEGRERTSNPPVPDGQASARSGHRPAAVAVLRRCSSLATLIDLTKEPVTAQRCVKLLQERPGRQFDESAAICINKRAARRTFVASFTRAARGEFPSANTPRAAEQSVIDSGREVEVVAAGEVGRSSYELARLAERRMVNLEHDDLERFGTRERQLGLQLKGDSGWGRVETRWELRAGFHFEERLARAFGTRRTGKR